MRIFLSGVTRDLIEVERWLRPSIREAITLYFRDDRDNDISDRIDEYIEIRLDEADLVVCVLTHDYLERKFTLFELDMVRERHALKSCLLYFGVSEFEVGELRIASVQETVSVSSYREIADYVEAKFTSWEAEGVAGSTLD